MYTDWLPEHVDGWRFMESEVHVANRAFLKCPPRPQIRATRLPTVKSRRIDPTTKLVEVIDFSLNTFDTMADTSQRSIGQV